MKGVACRQEPTESLKSLAPDQLYTLPYSEYQLILYLPSLQLYCFGSPSPLS